MLYLFAGMAPLVPENTTPRATGEVLQDASARCVLRNTALYHHGELGARIALR